MKKSILLLASFILMVIFSAAQQVPRNLVVLEIGTGTWCQYCPAAANGAEDLLNNGYAVAVIKYHSGDSYANTYSNARVSYYGVPGFPTAYFDGLNSVVGGGSSSQTMFPQYSSRVNQRMAVQSAFTIEMEGTHACLTDFTAYLTVTKVGTNTSTNLRLHAVLTEKHIPENWQGMTEVNQACRLMIPNQNGTTVSFTSGNTQSFSLQFSPNPSWVFENLELVVFLQDHNTKEIFQGTKMMLDEFMPEYSFDANVRKIQNLPTATCNGIYEPHILLRNLGGEILTSLDITYHVNNGEPNNFSWTGSLGYLEQETVALPSVDFSVEDDNQLVVYSMNPNGNPDECPSNDQMIQTIPKALYTPNSVKLFLRTDANPEETTWEIKNSAGEVLYSGGPYTNANQTIQETFELEEEDCHTFSVYDSGGDGLILPGFIMLYYGSGNIIYQASLFGYGESTEFNTADPVGIAEEIQYSHVTIFPNPVQNKASLVISLEQSAPVSYKVYTATGQLILEADAGWLSAGQHAMLIDASYWNTGLYIYRVNAGEKMISGKFTVR
ncbi:MAG: T9SS type A sorting domain-containing protein [Bacteroidales bacterium]|nr:T9SS type A sorting domain-containing protein [Bacteroidales bacterium]